jgi:hypothetical protein
MGALIAAGISGADTVDQVWHRRVALQGVYLITLDCRAAPLASAAPAHPPPSITLFPHPTPTPDPPLRPQYGGDARATITLFKHPGATGHR